MNSKLLRYLRVGDNPLAIEKATTLWREARRLAILQSWKKRLTMDEFNLCFKGYGAESHALARLLANSSEVWLMVATIGDELEQRARQRLKDKESFNGYILDRMGSYIVEEGASELDRNIRLACHREGLATTRRYSPGYQDFPIGAQKVFVNLAGDQLADLKLKDSGLLMPEKTITAVKGSFKDNALI